MALQHVAATALLALVVTSPGGTQVRAADAADPAWEVRRGQDGATTGMTRGADVPRDARLEIACAPDRRLTFSMLLDHALGLDETRFAFRIDRFPPRAGYARVGDDGHRMTARDSAIAARALAIPSPGTMVIEIIDGEGQGRRWAFAFEDSTGDLVRATFEACALPADLPRSVDDHIAAGVDRWSGEFTDLAHRVLAGSDPNENEAAGMREGKSAELYKAAQAAKTRLIEACRADGASFAGDFGDYLYFCQNADITARDVIYFFADTPTRAAIDRLPRDE